MMEEERAGWKIKAGFAAYFLSLLLLAWMCQGFFWIFALFLFVFSVFGYQFLCGMQKGLKEQNQKTGNLLVNGMILLFVCSDLIANLWFDLLQGGPGKLGASLLVILVQYWLVQFVMQKEAKENEK